LTDTKSLTIAIDLKPLAIHNTTNISDNCINQTSIFIGAPVEPVDKESGTTKPDTKKSIIDPREGESNISHEQDEGSEPGRRIRFIRSGKDLDTEDDENRDEKIAQISKGVIAGGSVTSNQDPDKNNNSSNSASSDPSTPGSSVDPDPTTLINSLPPLEITGTDNKSEGVAGSSDMEIANACLSSFRHDDDVVKSQDIIQFQTAANFTATSNSSLSDVRTRYDDDTISSDIRTPRFDSETESDSTESHMQSITDIARSLGQKQQSDDDSSPNSVILEAFNFERRRSYKIKRGDTLRSIAIKELGDERLTPLILQLNRDKIEIDRFGNTKLRTGAILILPSKAESLRYLARIQRKQNVRFVQTNTNDNTHLYYVCRLGDTLKTVAKRHPAIRDARMWVLIARMNNLSVETDRHGASCAKLVRGQKIKLPTPSECADFLFETVFGTKRSASDDERTIGSSQHPSASDGERTIISSQNPSAAIGKRTVVSNPDSASVNSCGIATGITSSTTEPSHAAYAAPEEIVSRIISQSDLGDTADDLTLKLELNVAGSWCVVVEYLIHTSDDSSSICVYTCHGKRKRISIELPDRAARELAENDLAANSLTYCRQYLTGHLPF
jgi:hypothetical protein